MRVNVRPSDDRGVHEQHGRVDQNDEIGAGARWNSDLVSNVSMSICVRTASSSTPATLCIGASTLKALAVRCERFFVPSFRQCVPEP